MYSICLRFISDGFFFHRPFPLEDMKSSNAAFNVCRFWSSGKCLPLQAWMCLLPTIIYYVSEGSLLCAIRKPEWNDGGFPPRGVNEGLLLLLIGEMIGQGSTWSTSLRMQISLCDELCCFLHGFVCTPPIAISSSRCNWASADHHRPKKNIQYDGSGLNGFF